MGYLIEISESKKEKLSEHIEKALHEMGKAMACVEQFGSMGERYGERQGGGSYGNRYSERGGQGGGSMGYRDDDDDDDWDDDEMMSQRRGRRRRRDSRGRYM